VAARDGGDRVGQNGNAGSKGQRSGKLKGGLGSSGIVEDINSLAVVIVCNEVDS